MRFEFAQLGDHVIVRSDGVPTYNFANPIDDADMRITHVIRGEDLLSSTPRQVLVYQALGAPVPSFAHLPLLFGPDRKRLSKRHGATSVEELREAGYLAEAVVNFLALLGWHFDSERELFTLSELIGLFSLERVNPAPAVFDAKKLEWMNGVYLRALPTFDLAERLIAYLAERGSPLAVAARAGRRGHAAGAGEDRDAGRVRAALLVPLRPVEIDQEAWDKVAGHERAAEILAAVQAALADCEWTREAVEAALRGVCDELGLKPRVVFGLVRVAITGTSISPGPVRERPPARPRGDDRAPRSAAAAAAPAPLVETRCATSAASACAPAENAGLSRDASAPRAAPPAIACAGVRERAPGSDASVPSASCTARPATGCRAPRCGRCRSASGRSCGPRSRRARSRSRPRARPSARRGDGTRRTPPNCRTGR